MHSVAEDIVFVCVLAYICNVLQMVRAVLAVVCACAVGTIRTGVVGGMICALSGGVV